MASMTTSIRNRLALSTGSWFPACASLFPPDPDDCGRFERVQSREAESPSQTASQRVTALHGVTCACRRPTGLRRIEKPPPMCLESRTKGPKCAIQSDPA